MYIKENKIKQNHLELPMSCRGIAPSIFLKAHSKHTYFSQKFAKILSDQHLIKFDHVRICLLSCIFNTSI